MIPILGTLLDLLPGARDHHSPPSACVPTPGAPPLPRSGQRVGIVGFNQRGFVIARPAQPFAPWLMERTQTLAGKIGGRTNLTEGLELSSRLLRDVPRGIRRRICLVSDGRPNEAVERLRAAVQDCVTARISIDTIGLGGSYEELLLRRISGATLHGRFMTVNGLRELTKAFTLPGGGARPECLVLAIDMSDSMREPMEGRTKIAVVEEALRHLLLHRQRLAGLRCG